MAYADILAGLLDQGGGLDQSLGVTPPHYPVAAPAQSFTPGLHDRILEAIYSGTRGIDFASPRGFGQSFLQGLTGSLAGQGSQVAARRAKFEAQQTENRKVTDARRIKATEAYNSRRDKAMEAAATRRLAHGEKQQDYERDNPMLTAEQLKAAPWLARVTDANGRVPRSVLSTAFKPETTPRETGVVVIDTPNGPRYVRPSQAVGQPPQAKPDATTKPSSGEQKQALGFYNRGKEALSILDSQDHNGETLEDRIAKVNPAAAAFGQNAWNVLKGSDRQKYEQAQRAFTQAKLRKESGAAITADEYKSDALTYFAQPGDTKEVIDNKRVARQGVLEGLKFMSGPAYHEFYGDEAAPAAAAPAAVGSAASRARPPLSSFNHP